EGRLRAIAQMERGSAEFARDPLALSNLAANRLIWHDFCGTVDCQGALEVTPSHSGNQESPHGHSRLSPSARRIWTNDRQHPLPHARSSRYPAELHLAAA